MSKKDKNDKKKLANISLIKENKIGSINSLFSTFFPITLHNEFDTCAKNNPIYKNKNFKLTRLIFFIFIHLNVINKILIFCLLYVYLNIKTDKILLYLKNKIHIYTFYNFLILII